jgi:hypothetical protein
MIKKIKTYWESFKKWWQEFKEKHIIKEIK